jgi:hypothetical protein
MTLPTQRGSVVVYRTDGGATTFGIVVRQQCTSVPGVLVVRELENRYPAREARVEQLDSALVRIMILLTHQQWDYLTPLSGPGY